MTVAVRVRQVAGIRVLVVTFLMRAMVPALVGSATICVTAADRGMDVARVTQKGLDWLSVRQSRIGHWTGSEGHYPTAITALAGIAILCEGSTTTQGKYAANVRRAIDFLTGRSRANGLIGDPTADDRYTYGHGFAMLFLSQVLGEEEDSERRQQLIEVLTRAVRFSGEAQTKAGGWGYVSAKDGHEFDEGSTTITQVQGLRGCRNAGIPVPSDVIDKALAYIRKCTTKDGGVQYNSNGGGVRPAITAAAVACLFNAGEYEGDYVAKLLKTSKKHLANLQDQGFGHWHYAHYYFAQVMYREGGRGVEGKKAWDAYRDAICARIVAEAGPDGSWNQGYIGAVYTTAINLTILQLENGALPIYQR